MGDRKQPPCPSYGRKAIAGDNRRVAVERDFEFLGEPAVNVVPTKECPHCGEVFPL